MDTPIRQPIRHPYHERSPRHPPLKELLNSISTDVQLLASQTLILARLEISSAVSTVAWSAIGVLASAFVAVAGVAVLVSALVLILVALGLPAWAAATVVGALLTRRRRNRRSPFHRVDA